MDNNERLGQLIGKITESNPDFMQAIGSFLNVDGITNYCQENHAGKICKCNELIELVNIVKGGE